MLIRRHGRQDRSTARRWALVDSRPGQESVRWGELPTDEHLLNVLAGRDPGTPSTDPIYLICTHGRHDACCAIRGRPAAAALSNAFPDRTWECSHVGGDRFAANLVFLPHSLFYGHVPSTEAVELAAQYNEGLVVPKYLRGSGAHPPPIQAAQHFARSTGAPLSVNALLPVQVLHPTPTTWQIHLTTNNTSASTSATTNAATNATTNAATNAHASTNSATNAHARADAETDNSATADIRYSKQPDEDTDASDRTPDSGSTNASDTPQTNANANTEASDIPSANADADAGLYVVTLTAGTTTIDAAMTCASQPPGQVTTYTLTGIEQTYR
ncbi:sucrase ferredoxin [Kribbella sp. NPDC051620]|uniref:sucrase ferredoxin n=1 Tax=Kribbella sp. NPDC051620 TaxID=3364120 RepID=UPI0037A241FC